MSRFVVEVFTVGVVSHRGVPVGFGLVPELQGCLLLWRSLLVHQYDCRSALWICLAIGGDLTSTPGRAECAMWRQLSGTAVGWHPERLRMTS